MWGWGEGGEKIMYSADAITWQGYYFVFIDKIYRTVQLIQRKGMKEMHLINFVNFALLLEAVPWFKH